MDQQKAQEILRERGIVIGPDDDRLEEDIALEVLKREGAKKAMAGVAIIDLPRLERGRPYFAG